MAGKEDRTTSRTALGHTDHSIQSPSTIASSSSGSSSNNSPSDATVLSSSSSPSHSSSDDNNNSFSPTPSSSKRSLSTHKVSKKRVGISNKGKGRKATATVQQEPSESEEPKTQIRTRSQTRHSESGSESSPATSSPGGRVSRVATVTSSKRERESELTKSSPKTTKAQKVDQSRRAQESSEKKSTRRSSSSIGAPSTSSSSALGSASISESTISTPGKRSRDLSPLGASSSKRPKRGAGRSSSSHQSGAIGNTQSDSSATTPPEGVVSQEAEEASSTSNSVSRDKSRRRSSRITGKGSNSSKPRSSSATASPSGRGKEPKTQNTASSSLLSHIAMSSSKDQNSGQANNNANSSNSGAASSSSSSSAAGAAAADLHFALNSSAAAGSSSSSSHAAAMSLLPALFDTASDGSGDLDGDMGRLQALLEARGLPPQLFGALAPRVQNILNRNGGSLGGMTSNASKAHSLIQSLESGDEGVQLQAVMEMCQMLVMGNEDTLAGFPIKQVVPALTSLLAAAAGNDHGLVVANYEIANHACRALTYMMESLPRSSAIVVDAVPSFLAQLSSIQCMDVAEQSLTALEMLSRRHSKQILHAKGVSACLTFLDFFSISAQRSALAITANCCQNLTSEEFIFMQEALPTLAGHLNNQDKKCIESLCLAFSRLVESYQSHPSKLEDIAAHNVLPNLQNLLTLTPSLISTGTFQLVLRMMSTMCASCPQLAVQLLRLNIADTIRYLLLGPNATKEDGDHIELASRSPQELFEITSLIVELMPSLPSDGIFAVDSLLVKVSNSSAPSHSTDHTPILGISAISASDIGSDSPVSVSWLWRDDRQMWHAYSPVDCRLIETAHQAGEDEVSLHTGDGRSYVIDFNSMQQINEDTGTMRSIQRKVNTPATVSASSAGVNFSDSDPRVICLKEDPTLLCSFIKSLFGVLYEVYSSCAGPSVRHKCLKSLLRIIYYSPSDLLQTLLKNQAVSSHISAMLASPDLKVVVGAIQMANILVDKLPDVFSLHFRREGVFHQMSILAKAHISTAKSSKDLPVTGSMDPPPAQVSIKQEPGTSSHSNPAFESTLRQPLIPSASGISLDPNEISNIMSRMADSWSEAIGTPLTSMGPRPVATSSSSSTLLDPSTGLPSLDESAFGELATEAGEVGNKKKRTSRKTHVQTGSSASGVSTRKTRSSDTVPSTSGANNSVPTSGAESTHQSTPQASVSAQSTIASYLAAAAAAQATYNSQSATQPQSKGTSKTAPLPVSSSASCSSSQVHSAALSASNIYSHLTSVPPPPPYSATASISSTSSSLTPHYAVAGSFVTASSLLDSAAAHHAASSAGLPVTPPVHHHHPFLAYHAHQLQSSSSSHAIPQSAHQISTPPLPIQPPSHSSSLYVSSASRAAATPNSSSSGALGRDPSGSHSGLSRSASSGLKTAAAKTSSFFANLHPARWGRWSNSGAAGGAGGVGGGPLSAPFRHSSHSSSRSSPFGPLDHHSALAHHHHYLAYAAAAAAAGGHHSSGQSSSAPLSGSSGISSPRSPYLANINREKVKAWIKEQAVLFEQKYNPPPPSAQSGDTSDAELVSLVGSFGESSLIVGSPAKNNGAHNHSQSLHDLTAAIALLKSSPEEGLQQVKSILAEGDLSSFEINHSGLIAALLHYLTHDEPEWEEGDHPLTPVTDKDPVGARQKRIRLFFSVFLSLPASNKTIITSKMDIALESGPLSNLVMKLNSCVSQLEQFPVRVHDVVGTGTGGNVRGTSALKFFNTHQLKCNLQRHPSCSNLRQWRGGTVKIDPLALVQAIERYLVSRGYGRIRDDDEDTDDDNSDEELDDNMAAMMIGQAHSRHKLEFLINDTVLPYGMTVYQAIRQFGLGGSSSNTSSSAHAHDHDHDLMADGDMAPMGFASMWVQTHVIYYRPVSESTLSASNLSSPSSSSVISSSSGRKGTSKSAPISAASTAKGAAGSKKKDELWTDGRVPPLACRVEPFLKPSLPSTVTVIDPSLETISLLRVINSLSRYWGSFYDLKFQYNSALPQSEFINSKLTAKANRQLQDPLVIMTGNLPSWLSQIAYACPFLFPFETRHLLFYVTCFDRDRALQRLLDSQPDLSAGEASERVAPRLERRKRTVSRGDLLRQSEMVLQDVGSSKALLEIQYDSEVGTGLGPTLEFYALVSRELQRADLDMWRGETVSSPQVGLPPQPNTTQAKIDRNSGPSTSVNDSDSVREWLVQDDSADGLVITTNTNDTSKDAGLKFVYSANGLFPAPMGRSAKSSSVSRVKNRFKLLGKFMAKALMDSRMVDIPLSLPFYEWLLGRESQLSLLDMSHIDQTLARSVVEMDHIAQRKLKMEQDKESVRLELLTMDGCPIEDLNLDFTLPGYPAIELRKGGKDIEVSTANVDHYVRLLTHWTLVEGVSRQLDAFREGFDSVVNSSHLQIFFTDELETLFCGSRYSPWEIKALDECTRTDHGYTHESKPIRFLFEVLASFGLEDQRKFLQFVTGSPRLPVGGLQSLTPPLTIVRKTCEPGESPDDYLPSVMTCVNYLKLPEYSSVEATRHKLRQAINEGQNSFHLS